MKPRLLPISFRCWSPLLFLRVAGKASFIHLRTLEENRVTMVEVRRRSLTRTEETVFLVLFFFARMHEVVCACVYMLLPSAGEPRRHDATDGHSGGAATGNEGRV